MIQELLYKNAKQYKWIEIITGEGESTPLLFRNNRFYSLTRSIHSGAGIRVNSQGRIGFSYGNGDAPLEGIYSRALEASALGDQEEFDLPNATAVTFEPWDDAVEKVDYKEESARGEELIAEITRQQPDAAVDLSLSWAKGTTRIINSEGLNISYRHSYCSGAASLTRVLDDGTRIELSEGFSSTSPGSIDIDSLMSRLKLAEQQAPMTSGTLPVLFAPRAFMRLLSFVAEGLNGTLVWKGISPFKDNLGTKRFHENFSLIDEPFIEGSPFSAPIDDEGIVPVRRNLIQAGEVHSFIANLKYAARLGMEPTGHGMRGYSSQPGTSFTNLEVAPGTRPWKTIASDISEGVYVEGFIGLGQSNTLTGDFSATLDPGYRIENGEITGRLKDTMISGNIIDLLSAWHEFSVERERRGSRITPWFFAPEVSITG